jgi:hypothetical protein
VVKSIVFWTWMMDSLRQTANKVDSAAYIDSYVAV